MSRAICLSAAATTPASDPEAVAAVARGNGEVGWKWEIRGR
jgi:hypothetical protein